MLKTAPSLNGFIRSAARHNTRSASDLVVPIPPPPYVIPGPGLSLWQPGLGRVPCSLREGELGSRAFDERPLEREIAAGGGWLSTLSFGRVLGAMCGTAG